MNEIEKALLNAYEAREYHFNQIQAHESARQHQQQLIIELTRQKEQLKEEAKQKDKQP